MEYMYICVTLLLCVIYICYDYCYADFHDIEEPIKLIMEMMSVVYLTPCSRVGESHSENLALRTTRLTLTLALLRSSCPEFPHQLPMKKFT